MHKYPERWCKESGLVCLGQTHSHELQEPLKHTLTTWSSQESPCLSHFFFLLPVWPICWIFFFPTRCFLESCQNFCQFPSCLQVPKPTYFSQISICWTLKTLLFHWCVLDYFCQYLWEMNCILSVWMCVCVSVLFQFLFVTMIEHHDQKQLWMKEFMI